VSQLVRRPDQPTAEAAGIFRYTTLGQEAATTLVAAVAPEFRAWAVSLTFLLIATGQAVGSPLAGAGVAVLAVPGIFIACAALTGLGALLAPQAQ
jgi:hypothetical protein